MTPDQEKAMDDLMELVSSLANLTQQQANLIAELNRQNLELHAQLEALRAIARAKL
jgi:hypothetical protein